MSVEKKQKSPTKSNYAKTPAVTETIINYNKRIASIEYQLDKLHREREYLDRVKNSVEETIAGMDPVEIFIGEYIRDSTNNFILDDEVLSPEVLREIYGHFVSRANANDQYNVTHSFKVGGSGSGSGSESEELFMFRMHGRQVIEGYVTSIIILNSTMNELYGTDSYRLMQAYIRSLFPFNPPELPINRAFFAYTIRGEIKNPLMVVNDPNMIHAQDYFSNAAICIIDGSNVSFAATIDGAIQVRNDFAELGLEFPTLLRYDIHEQATHRI